MITASDCVDAVYARLRTHEYMSNMGPFLRQMGTLSGPAIDRITADLDGGIALAELRVEEPGTSAAVDLTTVAALVRGGFVAFTPGAARDDVVLAPCSTAFEMRPVPAVTEGVWKMSRFAYAHLEGDAYLVRSPMTDCFLEARGDAALSLFQAFRRATDVAELLDRVGGDFPDGGGAVVGMFARAGVILPCDESGRTADDTDDVRRQWCFHDLLFHSMSRLGRTEKEVGGGYRFKDQIEPLPAVKENPWLDRLIPLPGADIVGLMARDVPLTAALETRRSTRQHSVVPLSAAELGAFLFRVARVRSRTTNEFGDFTSRPYPGGGALYEQEYYLTINACLDLPRGFYYYDPVRHGLCLITEPNADTEGLLDDAFRATAMQCRPQVLVTIASRFNRFNWKYSGMSYAAQLKNVGVVYQTMYLVATAMNIGACGLGLGDSDRFCRLTGVDYLEEGSIGEFMLGRPL